MGNVLYWLPLKIGWGSRSEGVETLNKKLMKFLAERRSHGKRIPLAKVKEQLGLA